MPYITSVERIGREKGIEQGIEMGIEQGIEQGIKKGTLQGEMGIVKLQLTSRFGQIPEWVD